jgi:hypothetical protein
MKRRSLLLKYSVALLVFLQAANIGFAQSNPLKNKFAFGIVGELLRNHKYQSAFHLANYNALMLDVIQSYSNRGDNDANDERSFGGFFDNKDLYKDAVKFSINYTNALKVFERAKIVRPAYGQRSTYQAEDMSWIPFPRYYYASHQTGTNFPDNEFNADTVRKCITGVNQQGYIVKDLIENCEQINRPNIANEKSWDIEYMLSDYKSPDWKWYVKPKMRIPKSIVDNPSMQESVVVRLEVVNFNNSGVNVKEIKVKNFKNNGVYNGEYTDVFYQDNQIFDLSAQASFLCTGTKGDNNINSQVDYRIFWPGNVDVYLDYVRVEDEWANALFNPDSETAKKYDFINNIRLETAEFGKEDKLSFYYMDECPINSFPCIAEVNKIIKQQPGNENKGLFAIMMEETAMHDYGFLKNQPSISEYVKYILDIGGLMTDVFLYSCYPFHGGFKFPSNLTATGMPPDVKYSAASSPAEYNDLMMARFQRNTYKFDPVNFLNGQVVLSFNVMSEMIKESRKYGRDISPAFFIQAHALEEWHDGWYNLREPTNEEMLLQGNLALVYGAKQVYLFSYSTSLQSKKDGKEYYSYGLMDNPAANKIRDKNYFGQNKWEGAIKVSTELQKIGDVLYPDGFDNSKHLMYVDSRSVNNISYPQDIGSGLPFMYIEDLQSKFTLPSVYANSNPQCGDCDSQEKRYWEFGFFSPPAGNTAKYFIALNKRSTPDAPDGADTRKLYIKFKASDLAGSNNWVVKNAVTNEVISTFSKNDGTYVYAGTYKPAEAKLLMLVPA